MPSYRSCRTTILAMLQVGPVPMRGHWLSTSVRDVLQNDGWTLEEGNICGDAPPLSLFPGPPRPEYLNMIEEARVAIPQTIAVRFHPSFEWEEIFNFYALGAKRLGPDRDTIQAKAVQSCIADYFYLIHPRGWIDDNRKLLAAILADEHRFEDILATAADKGHAFNDEWIHDYRSESEPDEWNRYDHHDRSDSEPEAPFLDLTACDKECGYCGQCDY
ncbi:hypothetical protein B0H19DRAFT_1070283 [Mycena capillaripes]|nr:hypothetical protein B0H19DRAFT_1070283 [Mycena capillaripes]